MATSHHLSPREGMRSGGRALYLKPIQLAQQKPGAVSPLTPPLLSSEESDFWHLQLHPSCPRAAALFFRYRERWFILARYSYFVSILYLYNHIILQLELSLPYLAGDAVRGQVVVVDLTC